MIFKLSSAILFSSLVASSAFAETGIQSTNTNTAKIENKITIVPELGSTYFNLPGFKLVLRDNSTLETRYKSSAMVGARVRMASNIERLSYVSGLQYIQVGSEVEASFGLFSAKVGEFNLNYLAIPLGAEYMISNPASEGTHYFISANITPSYLLSAKEKHTTENVEYDIRKDMNSMDYLAGVGFGGRYQSEIGTLEASVEFQRGLTNVFKNSQISAKNQGITARVGYNIAL